MKTKKEKKKLRYSPMAAELIIIFVGGFVIYETNSRLLEDSASCEMSVTTLASKYNEIG